LIRVFIAISLNKFSMLVFLASRKRYSVSLSGGKNISRF